MAKIKLNLSSLNIEQKVTLGNNIKTGMTGNATFTTPNPSLTTYGTAITALNTKNATLVALQGQVKTAMADCDAAEATFDGLTTQMAAYVENIANGDPVKIQSAGRDIKATPAPVGIPSQVSNLSLTASDTDGELDAQWDRVRGAKTYEIQVSAEPVTSSSWQMKPSVTKSSVTVSGLTSGAKMWVRIRAVGAAGAGAWSDPATKIAP